MGQGFRLPEPGECVGNYRVVERLGEGGFGIVFKAEHEGHFYAVKFLRGRWMDRWARRETSILVHLEHPNVVRFLGCGSWPDPVHGQPYLVMEYAGGRSLRQYAGEEHLSAREAAVLVLEVALTLGEVHQQGVLHRDLKPENILLRDEDALPVLVDFGVGALAGAPSVTDPRLPPGTHEFLSPQVWRAARECTRPGEASAYGPADEFWALGVTFYWLLTGVLPFGDREQAHGGGLVERILSLKPVAPHVLNARIPRGLSELCLRMLEKEPAARHGSVEELRAALEDALADADAGWDVPLFDPGAAELWTTEPAGPESPRTIPTPLPSEPPRPVRQLEWGGLLAGVLGVFLSAGPVFTPPEAPTRMAESHHEVAPTRRPLDPLDGAGEAPMPGSISAPVMMTMLPTEDTHSRPLTKKLLGRAVKALGTGLVCHALTGCPTPATPIRPTPAPEACPAGAVESMERLGLKLGESKLATFQPPAKDDAYMLVREEDTSIRLLKDWGGLPTHTRLSGKLLPSQERVFGRLTEAQTPSGDKFRICIEMRDPEGGRGLLREKDGDPRNVRIFSSVYVKAVNRFE